MQLDTEGKAYISSVYTLTFLSWMKWYRQLKLWLGILLNHVQCTCGSDGNDPAEIPGVAFDLSQTIAHAYTTKSVQHCENAQNQWYFLFLSPNRNKK